jgi:hypothetical protein
MFTWNRQVTLENVVRHNHAVPRDPTVEKFCPTISVSHGGPGSSPPTFPTSGPQSRSTQACSPGGPRAGSGCQRIYELAPAGANRCEQ